MYPVPFNSARAFVALGSWLVEGTKYVCRQGLLRMDLLPTERESQAGALFIVDTTWPKGAADIRWNRITSSLTKFLHSRTIFSSPFGSQPTVREPLASSQDRPLSHSLLRIPLGTSSLKNTLLLASHTLPTNSRTNTLTGDNKRDTFSLLLFYTCNCNKPFVVELFKRSFVIDSCCQIIYSVKKTNHFQNTKPSKSSEVKWHH